MGAIIEDSFSKRVTHIFTADLDSLLKKIGAQNFKRFKGVSCVVIAETLLSTVIFVCAVSLGTMCALKGGLYIGYKMIILAD